MMLFFRGQYLINKQKVFLFIFSLSLFCLSAVKAQKTDKVLTKKIQTIIAGFNGEVGVYVKNLHSGKTVAINADSVFPTASMVKVPILIAIFDKINKNELSYHQHLLYRDSLLYPGEDILGSFKDSQAIELSKVIMLMLSTSDNTASLWLQQIAGSGKNINQIMYAIGLKDTYVNSRTPGREAYRTLYGWGQTTPREMSILFEKLYRGEIINRSVSEKMLRLLGRNYWDEEALTQIPPYIFTASKNGAVNQSRSETILVMSPSGPYVFSIITKNQKDERWEPDNEGWVLARKLSSLLWNYFETGSGWKSSTNFSGLPFNK
jgi:beta-lactamase class A